MLVNLRKMGMCKKESNLTIPVSILTTCPSGHYDDRKTATQKCVIFGIYPNLVPILTVLPSLPVELNEVPLRIFNKDEYLLIKPIHKNNHHPSRCPS